MKIVCITPIKHLDEVYERLEQYGEVIYVPEISKLELTILLSETPDIEYLFTNPNKQNFILDEEVLKNSNIKVINTCSTGLNHIDMDCCERNNVKVWSLKEDFELINDLPSTAELSFGLMMSLLRKIPEGFDFASMKSLSNEAKEKLMKILPSTVAQASRISGVSPSDISAILVKIGR